MIDNFSLIAHFIKDQKDQCFYDLMIVTRGKDHPELPAANKTIKSYYVNSPKYLLEHQKEIISLCEFFKARAYINLAPKSYEKLAKMTNFRLAERIYNGDYKKIYNCFHSCAGELKGESEAWVVDVDFIGVPEEDELEVLRIESWLNSWFSTMNEMNQGAKKKQILLQVPTNSGVHFITSSFNLSDFKKAFPDIDVHKNNPTLLYYNP